MKYFIGQMPQADVDMFGPEDAFEHEGDYYYNMVEFGSNPGGMDDFVITDSVGRSIPLSIDHLDVLIQCLEDIRDNINTIQEGINTQAFLESNDILTLEW